MKGSSRSCAGRRALDRGACAPALRGVLIGCVIGAAVWATAALIVHLVLG